MAATGGKHEKIEVGNSSFILGIIIQVSKFLDVP